MSTRWWQKEFSLRQGLGALIGLMLLITALRLAGVAV